MYTYRGIYERKSYLLMLAHARGCAFVSSLEAAVAANTPACMLSFVNGTVK